MEAKSLTQREIKFRAWDKSTERMYEWKHVRDWDFDCVTWDQFEFMQYVGTKDNNGKEVYEGDVVKHLAKNPKWDPLDDNSPLEIEIASVVEFVGHGFWLSNESFGWEGEDLADWTNLEIIGNIYENPDLLTT